MRGQPPTKVFLGAFPVEACSTAGLHRWSISHYPTPNVTLAGGIESHLAHSGAVSCVEHEAEREAIKATGEVRAACWAQADRPRTWDKSRISLNYLRRGPFSTKTGD